MHILEESRCPYCDNSLTPTPRRKTKCKNCGNYFYVKTRVSDRLKVIVTEEEKESIEKDWTQYYIDNAPSPCPTFITDEEFQEAEKLVQAKGKKIIPNDIAWGLLNKKLNSYIKQKNFGGMHQLYYEMAIFTQKEGRDCFQLLQESSRCYLLDAKSRELEKVEISTAGEGNSCSHCQKLNGKVFTIEEALRDMPIPVKECMTEVFVDGKGFCRCIYSPVID